MGADDLLNVERGHSVGGVRGRQERGDQVPELQAEHLVEAEHLEQQAGVRDLYRLGISGGARGVNQRRYVVGLHSLPRRLEVEIR